MTLQCSLFASVYNSIKQYKGKMDLTFLPSNQEQLLAERKPQKAKIYHTNQTLYSKLWRLNREKQFHFLICNLVSLKLNIIFKLYCTQSTICIILVSFSVILVPFQSLAPLEFLTFLICLDIYLPYEVCPKYKAQSPNHINISCCSLK